MFKSISVLTHTHTHIHTHKCNAQRILHKKYTNYLNLVLYLVCVTFVYCL